MVPKGRRTGDTSASSRARVSASLAPSRTKFCGGVGGDREVELHYPRLEMS
ncbi:hypothetical protein PPTG_21607 [Phytophthora nicotianae INRA-310]|uniref:Uncharacterized protein n=1 Tax=Phytophthora nicotianae (strain INRA-310) TaxID=761204 RepID=W2R0Q1_PHYN3|nr:hypothetical protein PPTG_21607 [Phytophthora nicotianae INRA-310]ETN18831.1 hypothetical protein PPTG_21607 [Phytophthora nicotianae INRA-310]